MRFPVIGVRAGLDCTAFVELAFAPLGKHPPPGSASEIENVRKVTLAHLGQSLSARKPYIFYNVAEIMVLRQRGKIRSRAKRNVRKKSTSRVSIKRHGRKKQMQPKTARKSMVKIPRKQNRIRKFIRKNPSRYLITSALPYVNNVPHLGNLIGCVLSADVFARYCRRTGKRTLFICGTDEHGTATEFKAQEEGLSPQEICDKYYVIHKKIYEWFGCSFDIFGRTSVRGHREITQNIFRMLDKNKYILADTLEQPFCRKCDKFLADRFVEGVCPHCGYLQARGDQCDQCGKLLNPTELLRPRCKSCGSVPEIRKSKHLFLDLPKLGPKLQQWIHRSQIRGSWTANAKQITASWFAEGLKPRCITRDLKWGVSVPKPSYENKVFYVWFDAPIGYISITRQLTASWKDWWMPKKRDVLLYQFMAKDNIPFHSILFPATLLGTKQPWTLLHHLDATEYLNYEAGKFSKSLQQGIFGDDAMQSGIPADVWRYHLLVNRPETADSEFSWKDFQEKSNSELLANFGNFVNRTLSFIAKNYGASIPRTTSTRDDKREIADWDAQIGLTTQLLEQVKEREALKAIMQLSRLGNAYFQRREPWRALRDNPSQAATTVALSANLVAHLCLLIEPFLPQTAQPLAHQLRTALGDWPKKFTTLLPEGHRIGTPLPLFRKIEDGEIAALRSRFSGRNRSADTVEQTQRSSHEHEHLRHAESEGGIIAPFSVADLRVAEIQKVQPHPNADKLYLLSVDLGSEERQIVAGIRAHYAPDQLAGKRIVIIANLRPAVIRGEKSQGMLLAAEEQGRVRVLEASQCLPGESIFCEQVIKQPKPELTIEEFGALGLRVVSGHPQWNGHALRSKHGLVTVAEIQNGNIR